MLLQTSIIGNKCNQCTMSSCASDRNMFFTPSHLSTRAAAQSDGVACFALVLMPHGCFVHVDHYQGFACKDFLQQPFGPPLPHLHLLSKELRRDPQKWGSRFPKVGVASGPRFPLILCHKGGRNRPPFSADVTPKFGGQAGALSQRDFS